MADSGRALITRVLESPEFAAAPKLRKLLAFLYENRDRVIHWRDIAKAIQGLDLENKFSDGASARNLCRDLRSKLQEFSEQRVEEGDWQCLLPQGAPAEGFKLVFSRKGGLTALFWKAHTTSGRDVIVVYNEVLFFYDPKRNLVFRYWDTEDQLSRARNLETLLRTHPDDYNDDIRVNRFYVLGGEINARDAIGGWFQKHTKSCVGYRISRNVHFRELDGSSQILLGNRRTSGLIREVFTSEDSGGLAYTYNQADFGLTTVRAPDAQERKQIQKLPSDCYTLDDQRIVLRDNTRSGLGFGLITRIRHPRGSGDLTIVSASYAPVIERMARTLTDDDAFARMVARRKYAPGDGLLPRAFQSLIAVKLPPPGSEAPPGEADLVCWRIYEPADS